MLDTADRMPAQVGTLTVTGVQLAFPQPANETVEGSIIGGSLKYRWVHPGEEASYSIDLGAAPSGFTPNYLLARYKITQRANQTTIFSQVHRTMMTPELKWVPLHSGSVWLEQIKTTNAGEYIGNRHMRFAIAAGRWVLIGTHSSIPFVTDWRSSFTGSGSSADTYTIDVALSWGVFDL